MPAREIRKVNGAAEDRWLALFRRELPQLIIRNSEPLTIAGTKRRKPNFSSLPPPAMSLIGNLWNDADGERRQPSIVSHRNRSDASFVGEDVLRNCEL